MEVCQAAAAGADEDTLALAFSIMYDMIEAQTTIVNVRWFTQECLSALDRDLLVQRMV